MQAAIAWNPIIGLTTSEVFQKGRSITLQGCLLLVARAKLVQAQIRMPAKRGFAPKIEDLGTHCGGTHERGIFPPSGRLGCKRL